jgi:hypothetical protein
MPDESESSYSANLAKLLRRWDPRGLLITDADGTAAVRRLRNPIGQSEADLECAQWVCDAAVHPVLEQTLPSAFRVCSFVPVTSLLSLAMISSKSATAAVLYHWVYQSHSAATRYCNYADTSRPLDGQRMLSAYAVSSAVACGIGAGAMALVSRLSSPRLKLAGMLVPHSAVACAGALSTVMNSEAELANGISVVDENGEARGMSRAAARETVRRAVLLHGVLVPSCALLLPVVGMRMFVVPRLMRTAPNMLWPAAAALVVGGSSVVTPLASACIPPKVVLTADDLEPELAASLRDANGRSLRLWSSRPLY